MDKNKLLNSAEKIGVKPFIILVLVLLFLIPLHMLDSLVDDRKSYQKDAVRSILEPKGDAPVIEGFVIAVPFKKTVDVWENGVKRSERKTNYIVCVPETWNMRFSAKPEYLTRGIFKAPVFSGTVHSDGGFSAVDYSYNKIDERDIVWDECVLMLGISNKKNLTKLPVITANGTPLEMSLMSPENASPFSNTVFYNVPAEYCKKGVSFTAETEIQGGRYFAAMPIAADNTFSVESTWPTPGFTGGWLPTERSISDAGFSAVWNIAGLSTAFPKEWIASEKKDAPVSSVRKYNEKYGYDSYDRDGDAAETIQIDFVTPVDNYQKTERSIKYALLFLIIPFITIFIFEIFTHVKIHPVQYCLIGLADVIFYLLLLSVSEHISFGATYWISSAAVSFLLLFYAAAIFKKPKWGACFALVQMVSYIFLFGTLQAEDYALLIGSLGLFFVVTLLMVLTRKIDWYAAQEEN